VAKTILPSIETIPPCWMRTNADSNLTVLLLARLQSLLIFLQELVQGKSFSLFFSLIFSSQFLGQ